MNIQQEICEHYNKISLKKIQTKIRPRIYTWHMWADLGIYLILLGSLAFFFNSSVLLLIFILFIIIAPSILVGVYMTMETYGGNYISIGTFSLLIPFLQINKEKTKVTITPKSLVRVVHILEHFVIILKN